MKKENFLQVIQNSAGALDTPALSREQTICNAHSEPFGLSLTLPQLQELEQARGHALERSGRVEFGGGILPQLVAAFCDSPCLDRENYAQRLAELQELFYEFRNATQERLSDAELLLAMRRGFDGPAGGSVQALGDLDAETLVKLAEWSGVAGWEERSESSDMWESDLTDPERSERMKKESLTAQAKPESGQSGASALWEMLARQVQRYTAGESSSVPVDTARRLWESLCFLLSLPAETDPMDPAAWQLPAGSDPESEWVRGVHRLRQKAERGKLLWRAACLSAPPIPNIAFQDTLKSIGEGWQSYDPRFFAAEFPCTIDYPLCCPVPETLRSLDYIEEYLHCIVIENDLLRRFDASLCRRLLTRYCMDYCGQLVNLYEPIAVNALGLTILDADPRTLSVTRAQSERLRELMMPCGPAELAAMLRNACTALCGTLNINNGKAQAYLGVCAKNLCPRLEAVLNAGKVPTGVFLSF